MLGRRVASHEGTHQPSEAKSELRHMELQPQSIGRHPHICAPSTFGSHAERGELPSGGLRYHGRPCASTVEPANTVYSLHHESSPGVGGSRPTSESLAFRRRLFKQIRAGLPARGLALATTSARIPSFSLHSDWHWSTGHDAVSREACSCLLRRHDSEHRARTNVGNRPYYSS